VIGLFEVDRGNL